MNIDTELLEDIAVNTGSESDGKFHSDNYWLKQIAVNTGSTITGGAKSDNYYLREIAKNTGSTLNNHKNNVWLIRQIAINTGSSITGALKSIKYYLNLIKQNTDYRIVLTGDKEVVVEGQTLELSATVTHGDEVLSGKTVSFYLEVEND